MDLEKTLQRTTDLIRYRTVRDSGESFVRNMNDCMDYVRSCLDERLSVSNYNFGDNNEYPAMIASNGLLKQTDILLVGHIDVVDGEESQFNPYVEGDKLFGRGAKDMKSGVSVMLDLLNHYAGSDTLKAEAVFVSDEESGGFNGSGKLVEELKGQPQFVLTPDPGERHGIVNKEKGVMWGDFYVQGNGAHASRPWLSDCALKKAYEISDAVDREFNKSTGEDDWQSSSTMTQLQKALYTNGREYVLDKSNAIADGAYLKKDLRFTENDDPEEMKQRLEEINKKYNPQGSVNVRLMGPVCYTPEDNSRLRDFSEAVEEAEGSKVPLIVSAGASDMRFYSAKGLPCVTYGPTGRNHHAANEYVDIPSLEKVYDAVRKYADGVERRNLADFLRRLI